MYFNNVRRWQIYSTQCLHQARVHEVKGCFGSMVLDLLSCQPVKWEKKKKEKEKKQKGNRSRAKKAGVDFAPYSMFPLSHFHYVWAKLGRKKSILFMTKSACTAPILPPPHTRSDIIALSDMGGGCGSNKSRSYIGHCRLKGNFLVALEFINERK